MKLRERWDTQLVEEKRDQILEILKTLVEGEDGFQISASLQNLVDGNIHYFRGTGEEHILREKDDLF